MLPDVAYCVVEPPRLFHIKVSYIEMIIIHFMNATTILLYLSRVLLLPWNIKA